MRPGQVGDEERLSSLLLCPRFVGSQWQLPLPTIGERLLIGWSTEPAAVDGEPPAVVARLLAEVLSRSASVIAPAVIRRPARLPFVGRRWQLNEHFRWSVATTPDQVRAMLFEDSDFHWSHQSQVAFLAPRESAALLEEAALDVAAQPERFVEVAAAGALGVFLPGVDGAVAGLYVFAPELMRTLRHDLAHGAEHVGGRCDVVTEEAFAQKVPR